MMIFNTLLFFSLYYSLGLVFTSSFKTIVRKWFFTKNPIRYNYNTNFVNNFCDYKVNSVNYIMIWPFTLFYILGFYYGERVFERNYKNIRNANVLPYIKPKNPITIEIDNEKK